MIGFLIKATKKFFSELHSASAINIAKEFLNFFFSTKFLLLLQEAYLFVFSS